MNAVWSVVYCEGWDWDSNQCVGRLSADEAQARNRAGEQYSVLLLSNGVPRIVLDIAWAAHYLGRWTLNEHLRRDSFTDFRKLRENQIFPITERTWYFTGEQEDGDPTAESVEVRRAPDGRVYRSRRFTRGGSSDSYGDEDVSEKWQLVPPFGEWGWAISSGDAVDVAVDRGLDYSAIAPARTVWRPPVPRQADYLDDLIRAGGTVLAQGEWAMTTAHRPLGRVNLPTGRLVFCDPTWPTGNRPSDDWAFTEILPPGRYAVDKVILIDAEWGDRNDEDPVGIIVWVSDSEVTSWEMALRGTQDIRTLDDKELFGYPTSRSADGCVTSAEAVPMIEELLHDYAEKWMFETIPEYREAEFDIEGTECNLIPYEGLYPGLDYPTWIGRDAGGRIVCFLTDLLAVASSPEEWARYDPGY